MNDKNIARICHEANRAYCESIGDKSQVSWDEAPEWQKESAVKGVQAKAANPNLTPADMHASWCDFKKQDGWQYGTKKDAEAKTHPCMVPYEELPVEQRSKDHIFSAIVTTCLGLGGN